MVVKFHVLAHRRGGAVADHGPGGVALVHLDAVAVELIALEVDGFAQGLALGFACRGRVAAGGHRGLDPVAVNAAVHAEGLKNRAEFGDRLVGTGDDLAGDGGAFGGVAVEEFGRGLALEDGGQFPGEVEGVLDRGVGAEAV